MNYLDPTFIIVMAMFLGLIIYMIWFRYWFNKDTKKQKKTIKNYEYPNTNNP